VFESFFLENYLLTSLPRKNGANNVAIVGMIRLCEYSALARMVDEISMMAAYTNESLTIYWRFLCDFMVCSPLAYLTYKQDTGTEVLL
jgi:hypothetical protein